MKKTFLLITIAGCAVFGSCRQEGDEPAPSAPTLNEVGYNAGIQLRAGTPPAENTTFGFVSYYISNGVVQNDPPPNATDGSGILSNGSYAYQSAATQGILVPCDVDASGVYLTRNPAKGQRLVDSVYKTAVYSPALPMLSFYGSRRIVFRRTNPLTASAKQFNMRVNGYNVFEIPDTVILSDVRAKISIHVYQGASSSFTLDSIRLVNSGTFGWYHPGSGLTDISFGPNDNNSSLVPTPNITSGNSEVFEGAGGLESTGNTAGKDVLMYEAENIFVFANNYATGYGGLPLQLSFKLIMSGSTFVMSIPLGVDMFATHHYHFKLVVKSAIVTLYFQALPWDVGFDNSGTPEDIGGPGPLWHPVGNWALPNQNGVGDWVDGGTDSGNIGD